jgi:hypothetical protein
MAAIDGGNRLPCVSEGKCRRITDSRLAQSLTQSAPMFGEKWPQGGV